MRGVEGEVSWVERRPCHPSPPIVGRIGHCAHDALIRRSETVPPLILAGSVVVRISVWSAKAVPPLETAVLKQVFDRAVIGPLLAQHSHDPQRRRGAVRIGDPR